MADALAAPDALRLSQPDSTEAILDHARAGASVIALAADRRPAGLFVFEDELRPEAKATVAHLHRLGNAVGLVSGDQGATVELIAGHSGSVTCMQR